MSDDTTKVDDVFETYEADITVHLPGNAKATTHRIVVKACDPIEATARAIDEWMSKIQPKDIRIREVKQQ